MGHEKAPPKAGPYALYGLGFGIAVSVARGLPEAALIYPDDPVERAVMALAESIPTIALCTLAGLCVWCVVWFRHKRTATRDGAAGKKMPE